VAGRCGLADEVAGHEVTRLACALRQRRFEFGLDGEKAVVGVALTVTAVLAVIGLIALLVLALLVLAMIACISALSGGSF
jgi:hypothetical protein